VEALYNLGEEVLIKWRIHIVIKSWWMR
jgi:hypothetical protein